MRRLVLLLASMLLVTLLASGIAWAIDCKANKPCKGTEKQNSLYGSLGPDIMYGLGGPDFMSGENGDDKMYGGDGSEGGVALTAGCTAASATTS